MVTMSIQNTQLLILTLYLRSLTDSEVTSRLKRIISAEQADIPDMQWRHETFVRMGQRKCLEAV